VPIIGEEILTEEVKVNFYQVKNKERAIIGTENIQH